VNCREQLNKKALKRAPRSIMSIAPSTLETSPNAVDNKSDVVWRLAVCTLSHQASAITVDIKTESN